MGKIFAAALFLLLPILPLRALAAAPPELPRGQIIPRIFCAGQPDRSYALYLPSGYRRDREYLERAPRVFNAVGPEIRPDSISQLLSDLQIPDLKRKEKSQDPEERLSAERVLYAVYIQTADPLPPGHGLRRQGQPQEGPGIAQESPRNEGYGS